MTTSLDVPRYITTPPVREGAPSQSTLIHHSALTHQTGWLLNHNQCAIDCLPVPDLNVHRSDGVVNSLGHSNLITERALLERNVGYFIEVTLQLLRSDS